MGSVNYDCTPIDTAFTNQGAVIVPFNATLYKWVDLPNDLRLKSKIDFPDGGGIWEYVSKGTKRRFLLFWWSYEASTAPDGTKAGNHDFCGMYEITDK